MQPKIFIKQVTSKLTRRNLLKASGLAIGTVILKPHPIFAQDKQEEELKFEKPLTAIVLGAGNRGNTYTKYALQHPEQLKIVGVAEPIVARNKSMAKKHNIPQTNCFVTWEDVFKKKKMADIIIITTPDKLHYGPAMAALKQEYDLILEKPIAQSWKECDDIRKLANKKKRIVAICHVLRYAPYYTQIKKLLDNKTIGDVLSIQHMEPVYHIHYSHSYIRGNWGNIKESTPMILAKSCHDLDILNWWINKPCVSLSSYGSRTYFLKKNAPKDAPTRCLDGCPHIKTCGYSAPRIYLWEKRWGTAHLLEGKARTKENIVSALQAGPYGRCVFHCDNDQVEHQTVNMLYKTGVTAAFSMEALTSFNGRRTRIMGTKGDIVGDGRVLTVSNFNTYKSYKWDVRKNAKNLSGHGGGDLRLVADFIKAVVKQDATVLTSTLDVSMASHKMGFLAEESRLAGGKMVKIKL